MGLSRRAFVRSALSASGAVLLGSRLGHDGGATSGTARATAMSGLPAPEASGVEHVIVVMMENRSFDHFLGWLPNADGRQGGLSYPDPAGHPHRTFEQDQLNGCGFNDPDHSYGGGRIQYHGGKMD